MVSTPADEAILEFPRVSSIDTCSVWNLLCSRALTSATRAQGRHFVLAEYVRYECLVKPRKAQADSNLSLQIRLGEELTTGHTFSVQPLSVQDLQSLPPDFRTNKKLHRGEIAALALAMRLGNGFVSDDYQGRRVAENIRLKSPSELMETNGT